MVWRGGVSSPSSTYPYFWQVVHTGCTLEHHTTALSILLGKEYICIHVQTTLVTDSLTYVCT